MRRLSSIGLSRASASHRSAVLRSAAMRCACRAVVEGLEGRLLLSVAPTPGGPAAIGVNFTGGGNGGSGPVSLPANAAAGAVVKSTNYNNEAGGSRSDATVQDGNGAAVVVANGFRGNAALTYSSPGTFSALAGNPTLVTGDEKLNDGFIYGSSNVAVTNVPYSHFDLYVYELNDSAGRVETTTLTSSAGASDDATTVYGQSANPGDASHLGAGTGAYVYTRSTDTSGAGTVAGDYAAFPNLALDPIRKDGVSFSVSAPVNGYLNGFQIVADPWQSDPLPAPKMNAPAVTSNTAYLSWTASPNAYTYTVYRQGPGDAAPVAIATELKSLHYTDTGLTNGASYAYTVSADNEIMRDGSGVLLANPIPQFSSKSDAVTAVPTATAAPPAPPAVMTTAVANGVVVSWQPSMFATGYVVQRATDDPNGAYTTVATPSTTSFTDSTVMAGHVYYYEVAATSSAGTGAFSSPPVAGNLAIVGSGDGWTDEFFPGAPVYPGTVTGASPANDPTGSPATNHLTGLAGAPVNENTASFTHLDPQINESDSTNPSNGSLPTGAPASFNGGSEQNFSAIWEGDVQAQYTEAYTFYPSADDGVELVVREPDPSHPGQFVDVVLNNDIARGGAAVENTDPVVDAGGNPFVFQAGQKYHVWMLYNQQVTFWEAGLKWSSNSTPKQLIPATQVYANAPPVVTGPGAGKTPAAAAGDSTVLLTWDAEAADSYNVYRSTTPGEEGSTPYATGVSGTSFTDTAATDGATYYYTVAGVSAGGVGPQSAEASATPLAQPPAPPTGLSAFVTLTTPTAVTGTPQVTLRFPAVPFATSYVIQRAPESSPGSGTPGAFVTAPGGAAVPGPSPVAAANGATVTFIDADPGLALGQNYFYQVLSSNAVGTGAPSAPLEVAAAAGVEVHYYNNPYWEASPQSGSAFSSTSTPVLAGSPPTPAGRGGGGASLSQVDEAALLPLIDAHGNEVDTGVVNSTGPTTDARYPDPNGLIGPDNFSDVLTGKVTVPVAGFYTFAINSDDDGDLHVDGTEVSGYPGPHGPNNGATNFPLDLRAGTYNFQFFHANGGGGWDFHMLWNLVPGANGNPPTLGTTLSPVPAAFFTPLSDVPAAATAVTVGSPTPIGASYSVPVTFTDNSTSEIQYQLQRATDPAFDAAGNVVTVASGGVVDNGPPNSVTGAPGTRTAALTDNSAQAGQTYYYRVVALNYDGSTASAATAPVALAPATTGAGVEAHYYNNTWWASTTQNSAAVETSGVDGQSPAALLSDEATVLALIDARGSDASSGRTSTTGSTANALYPDPAGAIGPDNFSTVFTGQVHITTAGSYTFAAETDDDGYLYIDDKLVAADPGAHGPEVPNPSYPARTGTVNPVPIPLTAGTHNIQFFQSNGAGGWDFHLLYSGPDNGSPTLSATTVVPAAKLSAASDPAVTPANFSASAGAGNSASALLSWANNNTSAVRYLLQRSTDPAFDDAGNVATFTAGLGTLTPDNNTGLLTYTDAGLSLGQTYYYRIAAQNYDSTSDFTTATAAATTSGQLPPVFSVTAVHDVRGNVVVSFPASTSLQAAGYLILRSDNGGAFTALTTIAPAAGQMAYAYSDPAVVNGHTYVYQVVVQSAAGAPGAALADSAPATSRTLLYVAGTVTANHAAGFTGAPDLTFNAGPGSPLGVPALTSAGQLQLTATTNNNITSVFETTPTPITGTFETSFDFQFNSPVADGFAFVIQNQGPDAVGGAGSVGGGLGYLGMTPSLGVAFNMYNNVTQTALLLNGANQGYLDMSPALGNAFHIGANNNTDVFQVSLALDPANDATTGAILHEVVRDTRTGFGYAHDYTLPRNLLANSPLFGPSSRDYVGFTGATGGSNCNQFIDDWTFTTATTAVPPTVVSVTPQDSSGNGVAAGAATAGQRSMVTQIQVTFSEPLSLGAGAFTLGLVNNYGSGANDGSVDTDISSVLGTPANPGGDGITWVIPIVQIGSDTTYSYPLVGAAGPLASLTDGVFRLGVNPAAVTAVGGRPMQAPFTSPLFHRLFGDTDGNKTVNALDYGKFKNAFGSAAGAAGFNADLDYDNSGVVNALDYGQFKKRFGTSFTY